ncbi:MAG: copper oxidase [Geobacter sp.]|nr:MAG: copper oxidase [Geobacter sp.]
MNRQRFSIIMSLVLALAALPLGVMPVQAGPGTLATPPPPDYPASATPSGGTFYANSPAGNWQYTDVTGTYKSAVSNSGTPLRKFVDSLPGLGSGARPAGTALGANNLGQYLPVATPDIATYTGSDYYEIGLKDYRARMHSDLPLTADTLGTGTKLRGYYQKNGTDHSSQYLGPLIIATKNKPVRIKFFNELGVNGAGDLFIPVDTTYMGAGMGPDGMNAYTQNRADLHLHGGHTPWISDGTPHQWITPAGETSTPYTTGASMQNVPDMDGGVEPPGVSTYFYTNNQSGRLMFYHDHAYGITRLNVYAGEAAGYIIIDPTEEAALKSAGVPGTISNPATLTDTANDLAHLIPLVIQDKSFVPQDVAVQDAKWTNPKWGVYGDLWFPHVYETNQWPTNPDLTGANNYGRWDYGPWFWPVFPVQFPGLPSFNVSGVPESFMDTPVVNGTAYPYLDVQPQAYRLRILNAANDRMFNLSLFTADPTLTPFDPVTGLPNPGYQKEVKIVPALPRPACSATVTTDCTCTGAPGTPVGCFPPTWPTDSRAGGVPDPVTAGPSMIQIGTEGGLLPAPAVIDPQPVNYEYNRRNIVVLNVLDKALFLGPAERADVIVDFSAYAGKTVILYNDAPAPVPAFDPRIDYYTNGPDNTWMGGAPSTKPGYGPNTRTIMQFRVAAATPVPFNPAPLTAALPTIYAASQPAPVVPQTGYPAPYTAATDTYSTISATSLTFTPVGATTPVTMPMRPKTIQELFTADYGRMNATLGVELPFTSALTQTTIPLGYIDPPTEHLANGKPQLWKITHNGVDTHAIHFHLNDVQVINRVGWDGAIRPPDANELGWKDTVRMNPLEDIVVAMRPTTPPVPFPLPDSVRPLDVTMPLGTTTQFTGVDPYSGTPITVTNQVTSFGHEYVWHCHLLGHEENDMMRPIVFKPNDRIGVFTNGQWYLDATGNNAWDAAGDRLYTFGIPGDIPVSGEWDGNGAKVGVFNNGTWILDMSGNGASNTTYSFGAGLPGAMPVTGDWTGNGATKIGVFVNGTWYLDLNGNGAWDGTPTDGIFNFGVGLTGAIPVTGDWTGNGTTKIGVFDNGTWYLDLNGNGAWDGTPTDGIFNFGGGLAGAVPATGDWTGTGTTKIGVFDNGTWYLDLNGNGAWDGTPIDGTHAFGAGLTGAAPIIGKW